MQDRATGRSRGFAFMEMGSQEDATKAIGMFHQKDFQGRALTVNEARPREERPAGGGGGGWLPRRTAAVAAAVAVGIATGAKQKTFRAQPSLAIGRWLFLQAGGPFRPGGSSNVANTGSKSFPGDWANPSRRHQ
jgi:RNA recognition motif-containing protein